MTISFINVFLGKTKAKNVIMFGAKLGVYLC